VTEPPSSPPLATRVRDTFVAPARLGRELRGATPWLDVLLISTAIAMLAVLTMPDEIFVDQMRDAVTRRGRPVEIVSAPAEIARWGRLIGLLGTLATHPLVAFTIAGGLTLVFTIVGRGTASFLEFLSLTAHAFLIPAAGTLITMLIRLAVGATGGLTLASLVDPGDAANLATGVLVRLDPFLLWMLVVIAIGMREIDRRRSAAAAGAVLIGAYLLLLVASTALLHPELFRDLP
jgi:hypothetical protein